MAERVQGVVEPQRQADVQDLPQCGALIAFGQDRERQLRRMPQKINDAESPGQHHGGGGGGGCAADAQAEYADENEIADDVHKTADDQHPQRGLAVAKAAQQPGVEVVPHVAKAPQRCDPQIQHSAGPGIFRHLHQAQQQRTGQQADHGQRNGRGIKKPDRCAGQCLLAGGVALPGCLRNQDGDAGTDSKKNAEQNFQRL